MHPNRRQILSGIAGLGALAILPAYGRDAIRLSGRAFGTNWSVTLRNGMAGDDATLIANVLDRIDRSMSPFRNDSEISAFNAASGNFAAGPDFSLVTEEALRIAALSNGAFDPTIGPLVGRYGFGPIHGKRAGTFRELSCAGNTIGKTANGISLDLCGIAKGYALDAIAEALSHQGHADFLIDIGGELLAAGHTSWRVGIEDPLRGGVHTSLSLINLAIATSGDSINAYEVAGRRYSHIIDPQTGEPVRNPVASVSVLHPSAMSADGLATAMMVLGPEKGLALAEANNLPVLFLLRDGDRLREARSTAFADLLSGAS